MRLLDLFCGAGGAAMGYYRAGFTEIVGVDIVKQPRYPFTFVQADAMTFPLDGYDAIHASPPCQGYSITKSIHERRVLRGPRSHPLLVEYLRERLRATDTAWVIENVIGSPLIAPRLLCGTAFGLNVYRHRLFESPWLVWHPEHRPHPKKPLLQVGHTGHKDGDYMIVAGHFSDLPYAKKAMGIDWMTRDELAQAIPPAYTEWIGKQLLRALSLQPLIRK